MEASANAPTLVLRGGHQTWPRRRWHGNRIGPSPLASRNFTLPTDSGNADGGGFTAGRHSVPLTPALRRRRAELPEGVSR